MKTLQKLTSIYLTGFVLLAATIISVLYALNQLPATKEILNIQITLYVLSGIGLAALITGAISMRYVYRKNVSHPLARITSTTGQLREGQLESFPLIKTPEMRSLMENIYSIERILNDKNDELEKTFNRERNVIRTLDLLNELNKTLLSKAMVYEFLETILSSSTNIIKSEVGAIALLDRSNNQVSHFISTPSKNSGDAKTLAKRIVLELIEHKKPVRLSKASGSDLLEGITDKTALKVDNLLAVPILEGNEILGGLIFINKQGTTGFTVENRTQAVFISYQAAMAIEKSLTQEALLRSEKSDKLTGLDNHRAFHEKIHIELKRAERFSRQLCLLLVDIDFLKRFNDTFGQHNGNTAIKEISKILKNSLRRIDTAARYGGEAFTIILPETNLEGALLAAERIKRDVGTHPFLMQDNLTNLTVSIGVSVYPHDAATKEALLETANDALHRAKKTGRNKVLSYQQYMEEKEKLEKLEALRLLEEQDNLNS